MVGNKRKEEMNDDGSVPNLTLMLLDDKDKVEILMEQGHVFIPVRHRSGHHCALKDSVRIDWQLPGFCFSEDSHVGCIIKAEWPVLQVRVTVNWRA
jgi:hypothetical protein